MRSLIHRVSTGRSCRTAALAGVIVALAFVPGTAAARETRQQAAQETQQQADMASAAERLVPLLKEVRQRLRPGIGIGPGSLPPSPFTGRQSTLLAFRVGKQDVPVDPRVAEAIDRLVGWKIGSAGGAAEAVLFSHWLDQLTVKSLAFRAAEVECDTACLVRLLAEPGPTFGASPKDREEARDNLLLDALAAAVEQEAP